MKPYFFWVMKGMSFFFRGNAALFCDLGGSEALCYIIVMSEALCRVMDRKEASLSVPDESEGMPCFGAGVKSWLDIEWV